MQYYQRTGHEDLSTLWLSANTFFPCVSVRVDGARGLPAAIDLLCEVQAGPRVRRVPLLLSQADLEAGGGGRIDGGQLSERVDLLTDNHPEGLEIRLTVKAHGPVWTQRSVKLVGHLALPEDKWMDGTIASSCASEWVPIGPGGDGRDEITRRMSGEFSSQPDGRLHRVMSPGERGGSSGSSGKERHRGPALLMRVQCFERADLSDADARARVFSIYSADGDHLTQAEFEGVLTRVRRDSHGDLEFSLVHVLRPPF